MKSITNNTQFHKYHLYLNNKGTRAIKQGLSLKNEKDNSFRDQQFGIGSTGQ